MTRSVKLGDLLSIGEAAKRLPHTEPSLRGLYHAGRLNCLMVAGKLCVTVDELRARFGDQYREPANNDQATLAALQRRQKRKAPPA